MRTLNRELHQWWTGTPELVAEVPASRVSGAGIIYTEETDPENDGDNDGLLDTEVVIATETERAFKTNCKTGWKATATIQIAGEDADAIERVGDILSEWDGETFSGQHLSITDTRAINREQDRDDEGFIDTLMFELRFEGDS